MVHGRRDKALEIFDMLRQIVVEVEAIELAQNNGRHLDDVYSNLKDEHNFVWDEFNNKIDDWEYSYLI